MRWHRAGDDGSTREEHPARRMKATERRAQTRPSVFRRTIDCCPICFARCIDQRTGILELFFLRLCRLSQDHGSLHLCAAPTSIPPMSVFVTSHLTEQFLTTLARSFDAPPMEHNEGVVKLSPQGMLYRYEDILQSASPQSIIPSVFITSSRSAYARDLILFYTLQAMYGRLIDSPAQRRFKKRVASVRTRRR